MAVENISLFHFETQIGVMAIDDSNVITITPTPNDEQVDEVLTALREKLENGNYLWMFLMPQFRGPSMPSPPPNNAP